MQCSITLFVMTRHNWIQGFYEAESALVLRDRVNATVSATVQHAGSKTSLWAGRCVWLLQSRSLRRSERHACTNVRVHVRVKTTSLFAPSLADYHRKHQKFRSRCESNTGV